MALSPNSTVALELDPLGCGCVAIAPPETTSLLGPRRKRHRGGLVTVFFQSEMYISFRVGEMEM